MITVGIGPAPVKKPGDARSVRAHDAIRESCLSRVPEVGTARDSRARRNGRRSTTKNTKGTKAEKDKREQPEVPEGLERRGSGPKQFPGKPRTARFVLSVSP
jgi:hypothetical protein